MHATASRDTAMWQCAHAWPLAADTSHIWSRRNDRRNNEPEDEFQERVVQVRRVTKVVKGGKQLSFRAVVVVGDGKGNVGVGCASAKEVSHVQNS